MPIKKVTLLIFLWLLPIISSAQKLEFNGECLLFREAKTKQPVLIVNDSLIYKGFAMKKMAFKHTEYPAKLQEYKFFNIGIKTYLVHDGCGPVLEFRNDSIVRIDKSFLHQNQYKATHFIYNSEIYFFGGYGLFTTKNILTKFNFNTGEWIEVQTYGSNQQQPRAEANNYIKGNDLYIFGGEKKEESRVTCTKQLDNKVWRLHLPTMHWDCVGNFNQNLLNIDIINVFNDSKKIYYQSRQFFSEFDYYSNTFYTYERNYFPNVIYSYLEGKTLIGIYKVYSKTFFHVGDISEFKGKLRNTSVFIIPIRESKNHWLTILLSLFIIILLLIYFKNKLKAIIKPFKGIIYSKQRQAFLHKGKPILFFEEQEKKVLFYLLDNLNQYVSLIELNQLFENSGNTETISATVKRREQAVSVLLTKVSKITGIEEKELLLERKNSDDKRIKDILLLPDLLKIES